MDHNPFEEESIEAVRIVAMTGDKFLCEDRNVLRKGDRYRYYLDRPGEERILLVEVFAD